MKKKISLIVALLTAAILGPVSPRSEAAGPALFSDISSAHWAVKEVVRLQEQQLIGGYQDGTFRPDKLMTRAEAVKLTVRASGIEVDAKPDLQQAPPDVPRAYWALPYIMAAKKYNLVAGYTDGPFRPEDTLTRADIAVLIERAFKLDSPDADMAAAAGRVTDIDGHWAAPSISKLIATGIATGDENGKFYPSKKVSRIEFTALLARALFPDLRIGAPQPAEPQPSADPSAAASPEASPGEAAPADSGSPGGAGGGAVGGGATPSPTPSPLPSAAPDPSAPAPSAVPTTPEPAPKPSLTPAPEPAPSTAPGLPSPPAALSASASDGAALLSWKENDESGIIGYNVYLDGRQYNADTVTGSTYMLDGLNNGQSYSLYVTAINDQELESEGSAAVTVTPQAADSPAPAEVSGASATDDGSAVTLTWNNPESPDFDRVDIYLNGGLIGSSSSGSYTAEGLSAETDYSFTLRTVDRSGNASQGISLSIRTKDITPLTAPAQVSVTGGPSRVSVSWAANTESDLAGYNVYVNGQQMNAEPLLQNNYVATGLNFGTNYSIQVEAVDTSGNRSPLSVAVSATPTHYLIDLARWGIYNDGTHPVETVKGINQALAWAHQNGITATTLPAGTYLIDKNSRIAMVGNMLFDLPMDAILQKETNGKERYDVMYVGYGANNVTLRGGTYLGDKLTHDYSQREPHNSGTHEGGYGIFIEGAANTTIDGVKAMNFTGDGLVLGGYGTMFKDLYAASFVPGGLDGSGQPRSDSTKIRTREGIYFTHPIFKTERTFEISNLINLPGGFTVYFYRADGSFITSQQATARQTLTIPGGAAYFHLVFNKASSTGAYLEAWNRTVSQNTVVKNSEFAFNRRQGITVGGADNALIMNNILHDMKGTAPQSGIDVEGGFGQNGSLNTNIYIRNNEFYNNAAYDVILYDGHDVTVEGNHLASKGAIGLAVSESFRNALAVNNHFDGSRIVAYHDATFLNNRLNDSYTYFAGPNIIIDGMEVTNGTLSVSARTTGGIKVSNVNINITKNVDAGFSLNGKGIEVSNVTITGKGALTSFKSSTTESSVFNNIKVLGFNSAYGMTLPPGTYTNSVFEAADGSRFGQTIVANGKYSFDNCTFTSNATGNAALIASHAKLDLRITNSRFIVKGDAPAITVETANKVVLENNTVTAMNLARTATELIKINDYWKRNDPADVLSATITGNTITSNIAAVGISTIYAGTGAPPYTVTNNTLNKAVLALKSNDVQSGNILK